jgi:hypothetical protein
MKIIIISIATLFLTSCASTPQNKIDSKMNLTLEHMAQPKRLIGPDFEPKFQKDGLIGGEYIALASITEPLNGKGTDRSIQALAETDARARLLNSAPTDFKKIIQSALSTINKDNGSADTVTITITEVKALTGLTSNFDDVQCVTYVTPNHNMDYDYSRECRVLVHVPASNLMKAYAYTMDKKYGQKEQNAIQELLKEQLGTAMNGPKPASN